MLHLASTTGDAWLAREELRHFERVVDALAARGIPLGRQVPSPYAAQLMTAVRTEEPARLLDTLLCMGLIEARSCERLRLLAGAVTEPDLAELFGGLLASEARHHRTYLTLAGQVAPAAEARDRLAALARHEAAVIAQAPAWPRLHT